jgi:hypothetical protein
VTKSAAGAPVAAGAVAAGAVATSAVAGGLGELRH